MIRAPARSSQARRAVVHSLVLAAVGVAAQGMAAQGTAAQPLAGRQPAAPQRATIKVADRCAFYGAGFVDVGNGTCARVVRQLGEAQHVRVDLDRAGGAWSAGGTANAALRSDGYGMLPGAADAGHLRVPGGSYGR